MKSINERKEVLEKEIKVLQQELDSIADLIDGLENKYQQCSDLIIQKKRQFDVIAN